MKTWLKRFGAGAVFFTLFLGVIAALLISMKHFTAIDCEAEPSSHECRTYSAPIG